MSQQTRVTDKGQTTIPKQLREEYDIDPGDRIVWEKTDDGIVLKKITSTEGRGLLVPEETEDEEREKVAEELSDEIEEKRRTEWTVRE
jgi:AbrB family looped-hinge helix DNA binding protein